jgi:dTMP kinase
VGSAPLGLLITIEGIDAVGKRTQSSILGSWLRSKGLSTLALSFPDYGTTIGREIRAFLQGTKSYPPEVRAMLYAANRWEKRVDLEANMSKSDVTVVNRYTGSNLAYGVANGLKAEWLLNLEAGLPKPELVLLLDAPPAGLQSRRGLDKDTYERDAGLQRSAREAYLKFAGDFGWKVVDATMGIEATSRQVAMAVSEALAHRGRTI